jgi:Ca2+/Na+ antiporter
MDAIEWLFDNLPELSVFIMWALWVWGDQIIRSKPLRKALLFLYGGVAIFLHVSMAVSIPGRPQWSLPMLALSFVVLVVAWRDASATEGASETPSTNYMGTGSRRHAGYLALVFLTIAALLTYMAFVVTWVPHGAFIISVLLFYIAARFGYVALGGPDSTW